MGPDNTNYLAELHQLVDRYFALEEVRTLCYELGVDFESLGGEGKSAKIRELILALARTERLQELVSLCAQHRPNVQWPAVPAERELLEQLTPNLPPEETFSTTTESSFRRLSILNRVLLALCIAALILLILLIFLPMAEPILEAIALMSAVVLSLLPGIRDLPKRGWFATGPVAGLLGIVMLTLVVVDLFLLFRPGPSALRVADVDTNDLVCGDRCTVTLEGAGLTTLEDGQRLSVYGPHARLAAGNWSEAPIAVIQVLGVDPQLAFAQVLLIHEEADNEHSKRIQPGLRVADESDLAADFLVPAFGDGIIFEEHGVYMKPEVEVAVGGHFVVMEPQVRGRRIVDYIQNDTVLQVVRLGADSVVAETRLVTGTTPSLGAIVQLTAFAPTDISAFEPQVAMVGGGAYVIGADSGDADETPTAEVTIETFGLGTTEVTNVQFRAFIEAGGYRNMSHWTPSGWQWLQDQQIDRPAYWHEEEYNQPQQPVVGVSWYEAVAYANWLGQATGRVYRLPSEAEWERAACGRPKATFPWGDLWDGEFANFADRLAAEAFSFFDWADLTVEDGYVYPAPVGSYPDGASAEQVFDLAGNAWEWTSDLYHSYPYEIDNAEVHLNEPGDRVKRGGGWASERTHLRCTNRASEEPGFRANNLGFRIVLEVK